jgi:hypothetical protein
MTRGKGLRTKHLDSEQRFRVRVLFFDAGLTKKRIEEITGYTGSQIRTAISAKSHQVGTRSGRPGKEEIRRRNEEQQQQQQHEQHQGQVALEAGPGGSSFNQTSQQQLVPGFIPASFTTTAAYQPLQTQQPVQQGVQPVMIPAVGRIENNGTESQAQTNTFNEAGKSPQPFSPTSSNNSEVSGGNLATTASTHSEGGSVQNTSPSLSTDSANVTDGKQLTSASALLAIDTPAAVGQSSAEADAITTAVTTV